MINKKIDQNPIRYITKCGCELEWSGVVRTRVNRSTSIRCREHGDEIVKRIRECRDCGTDYDLKIRGLGGLRCPECAKKEMARKRKLRFKSPAINVIKKKRKPWSFDNRGDYCRKLFMCKKVFKELPCSECDNYFGIFPSYDPSKLPQFTR